MAKEHVTVKFFDSPKAHYFVVTRRGKRRIGAPQVLLRELRKAKVPLAYIEHIGGEELRIVMSLDYHTETEQLKVVQRIKNAFRASGYRIKPAEGA